MTYDALATIRAETAAFVAAAHKGLDPQVPGCPGWTVRDLTVHLGQVHRFHTAHVERGVTTPPDFAGHPPPPPDDELLEWLTGGADDLIAALRRTDPEAPAWNWAPHTPQVAAFWPRRMALETTVHRWDAESAHHDAHGFDVDVAVDGVDEILTVMGPAEARPDLPTGVLVVRTTDGDGAWTVRMAPDSFEVLPAVPDGPDALMEGTATALLLACWGRVPLSDVTVSGDAALAEVLAS